MARTGRRAATSGATSPLSEWATTTTSSPAPARLAATVSA